MRSVQAGAETESGDTGDGHRHLREAIVPETGRGWKRKGKFCWFESRNLYYFVIRTITAWGRGVERNSMTESVKKQ